HRVRLVPVSAPSAQAAPATLSFSTTAGGSSSAAQTINLSGSVIGLSYTASASAPWLSADPARGVMPATLQVSVDASGLAPGPYQGTVAIASPNALPTSRTVTVNLTVQPNLPPQLSVSTQTLAFSGPQGSASQSAQIQVLNTGGGDLPFSAAAATSSGGDWLG